MNNRGDSLLVGTKSLSAFVTRGPILIQLELYRVMVVEIIGHY
jgi:hypothetical protein